MKNRLNLRKIFLACGLFVSSYADVDLDAYFSHLQKKEEIDFSKLHNPFSNPTLHSIAHIKVQAIFPYKVKINNAWYKENDLIDGAVIKHIKDQVVIFEYDGELISIALENDKISIN